MATTPCHPDNSGRLPRGCGAGLRRGRCETDATTRTKARATARHDGQRGLLLPYPTQPKKNIRTCWPGCLMSKQPGKGANQCVIWGSVSAAIAGSGSLGPGL